MPADLAELVRLYGLHLWVEETFKDFQSGFGLDAARAGEAARSTRRPERST